VTGCVPCVCTSQEYYRAQRLFPILPFEEVLRLTLRRRSDRACVRQLMYRVLVNEGSQRALNVVVPVRARALGACWDAGMVGCDWR
jgi:hypothetical protein